MIMYVDKYIHLFRHHALHIPMRLRIHNMVMATVAAISGQREPSTSTLLDIAEASC